MSRHQHYTPPGDNGPTLFDAPAPVHRQARATERAAAGKLQLVVGTLRHMVWKFILDHVAGGATADEVIRAFPLRNPRSLQPRVSELARHGWIRLAGTTRPNRNGNDEEVWVANPRQVLP